MPHAHCNQSIITVKQQHVGGQQIHTGMKCNYGICGCMPSLQNSIIAIVPQFSSHNIETFDVLVCTRDEKYF